MEASFLQTKIAGVPLVVLVGGIAGAFALFLGLRSKTPKSSTSVDMLSPSSAEAFGTLQQEQQDVGNALSVLGMNQSNILQGEQALSSGQQALGTGIMGNYNQMQSDYWGLIAGQSLISGLLPGAPGGAAGQDAAAMGEYATGGRYAAKVQQGLDALSTLSTPLSPTSQTVSAFV